MSPSPFLVKPPPVSLQPLANVVASLRHPTRGCPWDLEQTHDSLKAYVIEEAYEVVDAIDSGKPSALREELGDLLLQVLFHAQLAGESQAFSLQSVIDGISDKMVRRHPHVFGDEDVRNEPWKRKRWEETKRAEGRKRTLDGVPRHMPALMRADILTRKAAAVGFDWKTPEEVLDKIDEELAELREALATSTPGHIEEELGDLLFAVANLGRKLEMEPETALRATNDKFERRFRFIEDELARADNTSLEEASLDDMEALWQCAKTLSTTKDPAHGES